MYTFTLHEGFNPNQSIKDRIAASMIETAEQEGQLHPGDIIIDVTSGNTEIGLPALAAAKDYRYRAFVQDSVGIERFKVLKAFGIETVKYLDEPAIADTLKATNNDFVEAVKALEKEVFSKHQDCFFINPLGNPSNPDAHYHSTGSEIWEDTDGNVDIFAATVGTGGTISGTGRYLKAIVIIFPDTPLRYLSTNLFEGGERALLCFAIRAPSKMASWRCGGTNINN